MSLESEIVGLCKAVTDNSTATAELSKAVIANTVAVQELAHVVACRVLPAPAQATPVAPEAREENPAPVVESPSAPAAEPVKAEHADAVKKEAAPAPAEKTSEKPVAQVDSPVVKAEQAAGAPAPKMTKREFMDACNKVVAECYMAGANEAADAVAEKYKQGYGVSLLRELPESVWPNVIADFKAVVGA